METSTQGQAEAASQVSESSTPNRGGRASSTCKQLAALPAKIQAQQEAGNHLPALNLLWLCKNVYCRHKQGDKAILCWWPGRKDVAKNHLMITQDILKQWNTAINDGIYTAETPSPEITLALSKDQTRRSKKTLTGDRPTPKQSNGVSSDDFGKWMKLMMVNSTLQAQQQQPRIVDDYMASITPIRRGRRDQLFTPGSSSHQYMAAPPPPIQPSSPLRSNTSRNELFREFLDDFVATQEEFEEQVRSTFATLLVDGFILDDFRPISKGGRVTMEDWLAAGGPKALLYRVNEYVPRWKIERQQRQKTKANSIGSSVEDRSDGSLTQYDVYDEET
jgi:hypothetical protein